MNPAGQGGGRLQRQHPVGVAVALCVLLMGKINKGKILKKNKSKIIFLLQEPIFSPCWGTNPPLMAIAVWCRGRKQGREPAGGQWKPCLPHQGP